MALVRLRATTDPPKVRGPARLVPLLVYGAAAAIAIGVALARGESPIETNAWGVSLPFGLGHLASLAGGVVLALGTTAATRQFVRRWAWARRLHVHLRPAVRDANGTTIAILAIGSAVGEELFFRGLCAPVFGLVLSSLAFGLLHQAQGRARWVWAAWATVMGLLFGALYFGTGSLLGPIVAHAAINVVNLRFLRDTEIEPPKQRRLGGLLGRA